MSEKIIFSSEQIEDILNLYTVDCMSTSKISKKYNVNPSVIIRILKENQIQMRDNSYYRAKRFNKTFFDVIDTEEKAYWLGFIYADGCVTKRIGADSFEIKLSEKDKDHLELLKLYLNSEHNIGTYTSSNGYNAGLKYCMFSIYNQHLVDSLIDKGVLYNKTHIAQFPTREQVPECLIRHFIRGYFDGDGSVYLTNQCHTGSASFTGNKNILDGILQEIKTEIPTNTQVHKYKNKDAYDLKIGGRNYFEQFYKYLYKDATVFLRRKKDKFEEILSNS